MKTINSLVMLLLLAYNAIIAQDTMYIYKSGSVVSKTAVTDIDSIIFYNALTKGNTVTDADGNEYKTVTIGTQTWMAENLRTTKFNDNSMIPGVTDSADWSNLITSAYCWYNNDDAKYKSTYGALYNWYTVSSGKLCPTGWHVSFAEYLTLFDYLGGQYEAGGKLKEAGTTHWTSPNTNADNSSGFSAVPGGYRDRYGSFKSMGEESRFWDMTIDNPDDAMHWDLHHNSGLAGFTNDARNVGYSVRCLRD
jgi:uncharacterized protein (TIGR02145 family)